MCAMGYVWVDQHLEQTVIGYVLEYLNYYIFILLYQAFYFRNQTFWLIIGYVWVDQRHELTVIVYAYAFRI